MLLKIKKFLFIFLIGYLTIFHSYAQEYLPSHYPDRITLSITAQPSTRQAVSWRTDCSIDNGVAQIKAEDSTPDMEKGMQQVSAALHSLQVADPTPRQDHYHHVVFEGLRPGTRYTYRVGNGTYWSEWFHFRTAEAPEAERTFSFIYLGDAQNDLKSRWSRTIRKAFQHEPAARFIVHAGDLINRSNTDKEWGEWHQAAGFIHSMIPALPTPGNHDHLWDDKADKPVLDPHWAAQFHLPKNGPEKQQASVYYTDYQQARFISLNSQVAFHDAEARLEQAKWLEQLLQNNTQRWTIVTLHHPIYSTAKNRDNAVIRQYFEPLFDKYGVDLVLQGHDHTYARGKGKQKNSPVYVLSVAGPKMYKSDSERWMDVSFVDTQLYQVITVHNDSLMYKAFDLNGNLKDEFTLTKSRTDRLMNRFVNHPSSVLVAAHRGLHTTHPENSIGAINETIIKKIDILEIDVRNTKDGKLVVLHDHTVDRTTNGSGEISKLTAQDIRGLQLRHEGKLTNEKIPTLAEVLQLTKDKIIVDIDFKSDDKDAVKKCYQLIKDMDMQNQVLFFTYDCRHIPELLKIDSTIMIMPRARNKAEVMAILQSYPACNVIHIDPSFYTDELAQFLQKKKIRIWANMLGDYDSLEAESNKGLTQFRKDLPYVNIIQTDLPEQVYNALLMISR